MNRAAQVPPPRLRVAAGNQLPRRRTEWGHGRVWLEVLKRMPSRRVRVRRVEPKYLPFRLTPLRRPDVWLVNGHDFRGGGMPPPVNSPAVVFFHEISWHTPFLRSFLNPEFIANNDRLARRCLEFATRVVVPSQAVRNALTEAYGFDQSRVDVVANGVDLRRFRPAIGGGRSALVRFAGRAHAPYVLYVASLFPRKNLVALREAMSRIVAGGFPHLLVIVAPPGATPELDRDAEAELDGAHGRVVRVRGPVSEPKLARLMAGADAFCLPSWYEGFGLVALEAMACGAPVVVSNCGALPEVVGDAGLVVEPSADGIEHGLTEILRQPDKAQRLRVAARARAEAMSWSATVDGWLEALELAAAEGR